MLISEVLSGDSSPAVSPLRRIERIVTDIERASPTINTDTVDQLSECVLGLKGDLSEVEKLQIWKLSYRIWNTCVDIANNLQQQQQQQQQQISAAESHARLRQIASEMLLSAGCIGSIRSSFLKIASFFLRTGTTWHKIRNFKSAASCFEKATEIVSKFRDNDCIVISSSSKEEQQFMFDLCLARSKTAWEMAQKALASSLLGRAREYLSDSLERHQEVADVYLQYGKHLLANEDPESKAESLRYIEQAYEICCEALKGGCCKEPGDEQALTSQKITVLRYIAAGQLQNGNLEGVLKCVSVLKSSTTADHPSTSFLAFKALVGLGRHEEAEKELMLLVSHEKAAPEGCLSALNFLIQETNNLEAAKAAFFIINSRFSSSREICSNVVEKLLKPPSSDAMSRKRVEAALSIATDERVLKRFSTSIPHRTLVSSSLLCQKELQSMHALLWNSGSDFFQAKDYLMSIKLFEASMLYLPAKEEAVLRAKALRVLCLCHLGLLQYDRAAEYVDAAEKLEPNVSCSFLKFKICLQMNDEAGAVSQVGRMLKCSDFELEYLILASHEAVACKSIKVAVSALSSMLTTKSSTNSSAGTKEVTIFRNLIILAMQDTKCQDEAVKYLKQAQSRLAETGAERFFGAGSSGQREASWFAGCAWNQGLAATKCQDWKRCGELFACASDFYALFPDSGDNLQCLETSLLLTVAALLAYAKESDTEQLKSASVYLERCRKVHAALLNKAQASLNTEFYLNLLAFNLKGRMKEYKEQLEIMYRCASSPGFKPDFFFEMAMHACNGGGGNTEVPIAAFRSCLNFLLSSAAPDYNRAAIIMRKLILLSDQKNKDGTEVLKLYKEANQMLLGLKNGAYPPEEVQWLVSTAWNRAALQVKLSRFAVAERWMNVSLELLNHAPGMESHRPGMMEILNEVLITKQKQIGNANVMEE